jgi:NADPH:quinone reductase-like Zn-dependent oxidoreductase
LGLELAGEVEAAGDACTRFRPGDRVMALVAGGAYATHAVVPEGHALPVARGMQWTDAAAIPEAFLTAWLNLFELAQITSGESVLVHAGASGVGSAAIQLGVEAACDVLATASSDAKRALCRKLGAREVFARGADFAAPVRAATHDAGVHVVLDFAGATYWAANLEALRVGGRLMLIGFLGGSRGDLDLRPVLSKSLTVRGTTLRGMPAVAKTQMMRRFWDFAAARFADGSLRPVLDRTFPLEDAAAAHTHMAADANLGKIILTVA